MLIKCRQCGHLSLVLNAAGVCRRSLFKTFLCEKYKVKFTLEQATKAQVENRFSLTSAQDRVVCSLIRPGRLTPGKDPVHLV